MTEQEILDSANKLKLLVSKGESDLALDLLRSLKNPKLYAELLRDCSIDENCIPNAPVCVWLDVPLRA